ncbi:MAG: choice-of-anchor Q domain-containing protein [Acidobacteriota bacterium]
MSDAVRRTALTLGAALAVVPATQAATFTVSNLDDSGPGSLRQAVLDANGAAGADVIQFDAGLTGAIVLSSGQLAVTDSVDVQGPGAADLAVTGLGDSRLFYLYSGQALIDVTISGLTLAGGNANVGGAIADLGENLVLDSVVVVGNVASVDVEGGGDGGGIWAADTKGGSLSLTIRDSSISGNTAGHDGGGIHLDNTGGPVLIESTTINGNDAANDGGGLSLFILRDDMTVLNSTISGNTAGADGGGLFLNGLYGYLSILETTVADNSAGGFGGGLFTLAGTIQVRNSIAGDNSPNDLGNGLGSASFEAAYSLVENKDVSTVFDNGGNIFGQDPQLGPLADNGGPTRTHLPAPASPVINAGDPAFAPPPSTDQRGLPRIVNGRLDMGSVEVEMPAAAGTIQLAVSAASVGETAGTITITATRTGGSSGAVSVTVNTADGTAVAPADYGAVIGAVLNWADGDTAPKTLNISIVADGVTEPAETFDVILSNPTGGAALGAPANEIVTIVDAANVVDVPTASDFGLAVLTAILSLAGIYLVRRQ